VKHNKQAFTNLCPGGAERCSNVAAMRIQQVY